MDPFLEETKSQKSLYFDSISIPAEIVKQLHPSRGVYRLIFEKHQDLQYLPSVIILKKRKNGWEDEFQQEIKAYEKLKSLQGFVIQGTFDDCPVIILSEVTGKTLLDVARDISAISTEQLRPQLEKAMEALHSHGAKYLDQRLDNFLLCDIGTVMIVDLEQVEFPSALKDWKHSINYGGVGSLLYLFNYIRVRKNRQAPSNFHNGKSYTHTLSGSLY